MEGAEGFGHWTGRGEACGGGEGGRRAVEGKEGGVRWRGRRETCSGGEGGRRAVEGKEGVAQVVVNKNLRFGWNRDKDFVHPAGRMLCHWTVG